MPLVALSCCGSYIATGRRADNIITITNLVSQTPPHFIDTGMMINTLALTGNILLALGSGTIVAWRLTEKGAVDGVFTSGRAGRGDSIWTVSCPYPTFSVEDQIVAIKRADTVVHVYHAETGEVLESIRAPPHNCREHTPQGMLYGLHYRNSHPAPRTTIQTDWVKDPEGKHQLWIPAEWRNTLNNAISFDDSQILRFDPGGWGHSHQVLVGTVFRYVASTVDASSRS